MKKTIKENTKKIQAYTRAVHDFVKDMEKEAKARGMTKKAIAKAIGRSATVIYKLEEELSQETALLICKLFNWERKDKFTEEEWALLSKGQPIVGQKEQTQDTDEKLIEIACLKAEIEDLENQAEQYRVIVKAFLKTKDALLQLAGIMERQYKKVFPEPEEVTVTLTTTKPEGEGNV